LALFFGANDMGSVMMEENVVSAAGRRIGSTSARSVRLIRDAGWTPAQRDQYYNVLKKPRGADLARRGFGGISASPSRSQIDDRFVGAAPGLDDGADQSVKGATADPGRRR
jgi:cyclic dehypoxanthinyl futalosine synthase